MRWGNSSLGQIMDSTATMHRDGMKAYFTSVVHPGPFSAGCETNRSCKAGLLTRSGFDAFPVIRQWLKIVDPSCARFRTGTYSSGNCCRLSRHSLLIGRRLWALLSNLCAAKIVKFGIRSGKCREFKMRKPRNRRITGLSQYKTYQNRTMRTEMSVIRKSSDGTVIPNAGIVLKISNWWRVWRGASAVGNTKVWFASVTVAEPLHFRLR